MKYDLIFSDFDGTLLRDDLTVGQRSADAYKGLYRRAAAVLSCAPAECRAPWIRGKNFSV